MILYHPILFNPVLIEENKINVIVIENPKELRNFITDLIRQTSGDMGEFILSNENVQIELSKHVEVITDPFTLSFNNKKITNSINQIAVTEANNYPEKINHLLSELNDFAYFINTSLSYDVCFSNIETINEIIKVLDFKIDSEGCSIPETILNYVKLQRDFLGKDLVIIYNLKACMEESELKSFYRDIQYNKLNILLIEDSQRNPSLMCEQYRIIDKDLCVF